MIEVLELLISKVIGVGCCKITRWQGVVFGLVFLCKAGSHCCQYKIPAGDVKSWMETNDGIFP